MADEKKQRGRRAAKDKDAASGKFVPGNKAAAKPRRIKDVRAAARELARKRAAKLVPAAMDTLRECLKGTDPRTRRQAAADLLAMAGIGRPAPEQPVSFDDAPRVSGRPNGLAVTPAGFDRLSPEQQEQWRALEARMSPSRSKIYLPEELHAMLERLVQDAPAAPVAPAESAPAPPEPAPVTTPPEPAVTPSSACEDEGAKIFNLFDVLHRKDPNDAA